jgi:hypothetical protein
VIREIDNYFLQKEEPVKSCLLFLRDYILSYDEAITEVWHYRMPFYFYNGKRFCYVWVQKKNQLPYVGIVDGKLIDHPNLVQEERTRMKILLFDPKKDIPLKTLRSVLDASLKLHKQKRK